MKLTHQKTSRVDEQELTKAIESLSDYQSHLQKIVNDGGYDSDEASINLPSDNELIQRVMQMVGKKKSDNLKYIIVIGIGGSNLGTKAFYDALYGYYDVMRNDRFPKMIFLDTQDADVLTNLSSLLSSLTDPHEILINAISKSGGTTETMANFEVVFGMLKDRFSSIADRIVFTTNENSKLNEAGNKSQIDVLNLPDKVGGRYSIFSAVGLFPLSMLGINIEELMTSAVNMRDICVNSHGVENPALVSAGILFTQSQQGKNINDNFIFAPQLESMGKWYRQLMGESIGKDGKGITPTVSIGSTDLHSVGQLYLGGPKDKTTTFIYTETGRGTVLVPQETHLKLVEMIAGQSISLIMKAIVQGTKKAYEKQELPYMEIELESISVAEIAAFMQFKMVEMMYLGKLMGVNTFDQPHVELYKTEVKRILEGSLKETMEIMSDPTLMAAIREGEEDIKAGRYQSWEDVKKELDL
jgi:glucose-6-phosphate isomerase